MKKFITAILIMAGTAALLYPDTGLGYTGLNNIILAQADTDDAPAIETEGVTPRIKSKKRAEYREGKSPLVAAGLSLLVPGAGEFYGKDYIRSGIFFGIDVFTLSMWYYYDGEGDDKKDEYREYADRNFDENIYYGGLLGMTQNFKSYLEDQSSTDRYDASEIWSYEYFSNRDNWTWDYNDSLSVYDMLKLSFESDTFNNAGSPVLMIGTANQFTHNLPETKTQQYYEMIGKYHQFACGWNDFDGYDYNADGTVVMVTDSVYSSTTNDYVYLERPKMKDGAFDYTENGYNSPQVDFYEDLRDETNQAYEMGQNFLMVTLLNHVASAFDASYVIKKNYQIDTQLRIENSDKADKLGLDNYKVTYSVMW